MLLQVTLVKILRLIQRHLIRNEFRKSSDDGNKEFLLDASNSFKALTKTIKRTNSNVTRHNHKSSGLLGLGHGGEDEHGGDGLEINSEFGVFKTHAVREVATEGLGATISTEVGGGHEAVRRGDGDDGTGLGFAHAGEDEVGEAEDGLAVDVEDVDFLVGSFVLIN